MSTGAEIIVARRQFLTSRLKNIVTVALDTMSESVKQNFAASLVEVTLQTMGKDSQLLKASEASIYQCVLACAYMGLKPGGPMPDVHLVVFGNECIPIIDYRCEVRLAMECSGVKSVESQPVYDGDVLDYEYGTNSFLKHIPKDGVSHGTDKLTHAWAMAIYEDDSKKFVVMPRQDILKVMQSSRASGKGPWVSWFERMACKTAVHQLCNLMAMTGRQRAVHEIEKQVADGPLNLKEAEVVLEPETKMDVIRKQLGAGPKKVEAKVVDEPPPAADALPPDEAKEKGLLVMKLCAAAKDPNIDAQLRGPSYANTGDEAQMLDILNAQTLARLRDWAAGLEG